MGRGKITRPRHFYLLISLGLLAALPFGGAQGGPRMIEILADKDAKFKVTGQKEPVVTLKAGEVVVLRITSRKGSEWAKDGATHSLAIKGLKDQGWDLRLYEGTKDFTVVAPAEPGEYLAECIVRCGPRHEDMRMKFIVTP